MSDQRNEEESFINSVVGEGARFRGDLELNGLVRVDGDFSGSIKTQGKVFVGKNGRAECNISASTVVVGGVVKGNIFSTEKVVILSTGMVMGNITAPELIVEDGVILHGECIISTRAKDTISSGGNRLKQTYFTVPHNKQELGSIASSSWAAGDSRGLEAHATRFVEDDEESMMLHRDSLK